MIANLEAIYEGNGVLRLLDAPPELVPQQKIQIQILEPEPALDWGEPSHGTETLTDLSEKQNEQVELELFDDELEWNAIPRAPSAESVTRNMGLLQINDPELARQLAFGLEFAIWNQSYE